MVRCLPGAEQSCLLSAPECWQTAADSAPFLYSSTRGICPSAPGFKEPAYKSPVPTGQLVIFAESCWLGSLLEVRHFLSCSPVSAKHEPPLKWRWIGPIINSSKYQLSAEGMGISVCSALLNTLSLFTYYAEVQWGEWVLGTCLREIHAVASSPGLPGRRKTLRDQREFGGVPLQTAGLGESLREQAFLDL